jgi:hypothetical protein
MSVIANVILGFAQSVANARNSILVIRITKTGVKYSFKPKSSDSEKLYEGHYDNVEFYLGEMANPVKLDVNPEQYNKHSTVDVLENSISTKKYKTFMEQEALERMFNVTGPKQEQIMKLLYATIAGIVVIGILLIAMYSGGA